MIVTYLDPFLSSSFWSSKIEVNINLLTNLEVWRFFPFSCPKVMNIVWVLTSLSLFVKQAFRSWKLKAGLFWQPRLTKQQFK